MAFTQHSLQHPLPQWLVSMQSSARHGKTQWCNFWNTKSRM